MTNFVYSFLHLLAMMLSTMCRCFRLLFALIFIQMWRGKCKHCDESSSDYTLYNNLAIDWTNRANILLFSFPCSHKCGSYFYLIAMLTELWSWSIVVVTMIHHLGKYEVLNVYFLFLRVIKQSINVITNSLIHIKLCANNKGVWNTCYMYKL